MISTGTVLGTATFAMVALTGLAMIAVVCLLFVGDAHLVALGLLLASAILIASVPLSSGADRLAERAHLEAERGRKSLGYVLAALSSALIPALVVTVNLALVDFLATHPSDRTLLWWLLSYGVATGGWTFRAQIASSRSRTLSSIQAYAAHFSYALISAGVLLLGLSPIVALALVVVPQALPFAVGFFLALADRNALRDVQI